MIHKNIMIINYHKYFYETMNFTLYFYLLTNVIIINFHKHCMILEPQF